MLIPKIKASGSYQNLEELSNYLEGILDEEENEDIEEVLEEF